MNIVGIIPARYQSQRFPGKALEPLPDGRAMVVHCWERVKEAERIGRVIVATDDERIAAVIRAAGGEAAMTSPECRTGSDRVAEVVRAQGADWDIVVNIQGDEPTIDPGVIDAVAGALADSPDCGVSTAKVALRDREEFLSPSNVKVVCTPDGRALYFSRAPIPSIARLDEGAVGTDFVWGYKHLGLYAYRRQVLLDYTERPQTPLEVRECLEQLRLMENGIGLRVVEVEHDSVGVDTPEELEKLRKAVASGGRAGRVLS